MAKGTTENPLTSLKKSGAFRLSLRYKLSVPVTIFVTLMLVLLFYTTFYLVRGLVAEGIEERLKALTMVFTETLKAPMIVGKDNDVIEIMKWMEGQKHVAEVRVEDWDGKLIASVNPMVTMPAEVMGNDFVGIHRLSTDSFVVADRIQEKDRILGRVLVVYDQLGIEARLKSIFQERVQMAFAMVALLALLIMILTWIAIQPLFALKKAAKQILAGDLDARANIHSFDEIEDLSDAFNEMVNRLGKSLDRLRLRTEALEESEEKYRLIIENASDIIFTLTPDGELLLLNRGFSGCVREELLREGLPLVMSVHTDESKKILQQSLEDVMRGKTSVNNVAVTHIQRGSKNEVFYLVNLTPVVGHDGEVKLIQGVMRDITELRRIEMMKESLIRDVAHELKTPGAKFEMAVNWFEKELIKRNEKKAYEEIVKILRNNIDRLMQTVNSILDLSKLESGMDKVALQPINLNDTLEEVCRDMQPLVEGKKLSFEYRLSSEALPMQGDAPMLYRLFCNLLQNAIKFTDVGKISLVSLLHEGQIHVKVQDTGLGIEADNIEMIFERFVQKTASSMGIGVGLTIVRDIAALHQGRVWAESGGLGKGAVFHVVFPKLG